MIDLKNLPDDYEPPALYNMLVGRLCVHGFEPPLYLPREEVLPREGRRLCSGVFDNLVIM
jgi:hypothetical protein